MRSLRYILLLALIDCGGASAQVSLAERLRVIASSHHGDVAIFAENLQTHETVSLAPDTVVQAASVIKLTILYEAIEQIRSGKTRWDDRITVNAADRVGGSGLIQYFDSPLPLTFKDVLTMMIVVSDNTAANLAIEHLGLDNINHRTATLGLKNTYLYKKVFTPVAPGIVLPDDFKQFGLGKTTPREIAALMTKFVTCDLATASNPKQPTDQALCDVALKMLHLQFYRTAIPRYLEGMPGATGDSMANKTGSLDAVRADVAAVSTRRGMVVIAAFTYNNQYRAWTQEHEGELTIAKLARVIIESWSPDGLAPWPKFAALPHP
jgi:beta-lactamase class A